MKNFFSILVIFVFLLGCCSEVNAAESKKSKTRVSAKSTKSKLSKKKKSVTQVAKKIPKKSVTVAKATETVSEEAPQSITYVERANKNSKPILHFKSDGSPQLEDLESLSDLEDSSVITDTEGDKIKLTLDIGLQKKAAKILQTYALPWSTVVAINPKSGKILALAGYSAKDPSGQQFLTKASFPAASLFKLITASAAVEQKGLNGDDTIYFRGGNYTISQNNYYPDERLDRRQITFADALGKSINPAFARVALNNLTSSSLERFAHAYL
ncbi:MAG: hypothetical protein KBC84_10260, partial [Proteobacteria bacterium]|nr:hypothetical protein [Pseudomonadota bacterium]